MHKAPYWSVHNYESRVGEGVRTAFLQHVERVHVDSRSELAGMCVPVRTVADLSFACNTFHYPMTQDSTGWPEIWLSHVASKKTGQNENLGGKKLSDKVRMEDAISKMMGTPKSRVDQAAGAASPARERSPSAASAQAAASPAKERHGSAASPAKERRGSAASAQAAASPAKERAQAAAGPAAATASPGRRRAPSGDAGAE